MWNKGGGGGMLTTSVNSWAPGLGTGIQQLTKGRYWASSLNRSIVATGNGQNNYTRFTTRINGHVSAFADISSGHYLSIDQRI